MPLIKGKSNQTRAMNIHEMIQAGYPPKQAAAAAYRMQRESKKKKKKGTT